MPGGKETHTDGLEGHGIEDAELHRKQVSIADGLDEEPYLAGELIDALDEAFDLKKASWDIEGRACKSSEPSHDDEIARLDAQLSDLRSAMRPAARRASGRS